ncbi:MAG: hypothetical protein NT094_03685 [Candidatus Staskawiczbacteria bacterium]|nr:hypothetical protein [Candidatus Staskawiczbacteria bacterium]
MNQKNKIWLIFSIIFIIILIGLIGGWLMLYFKPIQQFDLGYQQSSCTYDLQNPDRKAKYVSSAPADITKKYFPVWKKLFMEKNNINENYFNKYILVKDTGISTDQSRQLSPTNRGREYFEVLYNIKVDWIEFCNADNLVIRKKDYQEYLSIEEFIKEEQDAEETFQKVSSFIPIEKAPMSFNEAVKKLQQINSDAAYLKPVYLSLGFGSPSWDKEHIANGGVLLYGRGTINFKDNQCVDGYFNIVTGKGSTTRYPCWIE